MPAPTCLVWTLTDAGEERTTPSLVWTLTDAGEERTTAVGVVRECFGARCLGKGWPNESQSHLLNMLMYEVNKTSEYPSQCINTH